MSTYLLINAEGKAYNRIVLEKAEDYPVPAGHMLTLVSEAPDGLQWVSDETSDSPLPIIEPITTRQFLIQAATVGMITWEEAASSAVPASIQAVFDTLPEPQNKAAVVTWMRMTTIERNHPLVIAAGAAFGMTAEQLDAFFVEAAGV